MKKAISLLLTITLCLALVPFLPAAEAGFENFKKVNTYRDGVFSDVKSSDWFRDDVAVCYELGLITGYDDGTFRPDDNVSAAEAAALAARVGMIWSYGRETDRYGNYWYSSYFDYLASKAMAPAGASGWAVGTYRIEADPEMADGPAPRFLVAIYMAYVMPEDAYEKINDIRDDEIPDVSMAEYQDIAEVIYKLYRAGILTGSDGGYFLPNDHITRGEMAAIVARMVRTDRRRSFTLVEHASPILPSLSAFLNNSASVIEETGTDSNGLSIRRDFANRMSAETLDEYMELLQSKYGMEITGTGSSSQTSGSSKYYALAFKDGRGKQMTYKYLRSVYTGYETLKGNVILEYTVSWGSPSVTLMAPTDIDFLDTGERTGDSQFAQTETPDEYGGGGFPPERPTLPDMAAFFNGQVAVTMGRYRTESYGTANSMSATLDTLDFDALQEYLELLMNTRYGFVWTHHVEDLIRSTATCYDTYSLLYYGGGQVSTVDESVGHESGNVLVLIGRDFRTGVMNVNVVYPNEFAVVDPGWHTSFNDITDRSGGAPAAPGSGATVTPSTGSRCTYCNGTGHRICISCHGLGTVTYTGSVPNYGAGGGSYSVTKRCPNDRCHDGFVDCAFCGGDGVR